MCDGFEKVKELSSVEKMKANLIKCDIPENLHVDLLFLSKFIGLQPIKIGPDKTGMAFYLRSRVSEKTAPGEWPEMGITIERDVIKLEEYSGNLLADAFKKLKQTSVSMPRGRRWPERFLDLERASNDIARQSRRGRGNVILSNKKQQLKPAGFLAWFSRTSHSVKRAIVNLNRRFKGWEPIPWQERYEQIIYPDIFDETLITYAGATQFDRGVILLVGYAEGKLWVGWGTNPNATAYTRRFYDGC